MVQTLPYAGGMTEAARERRRRVSMLSVEGTGWDIGTPWASSSSTTPAFDHARYITGQAFVVDGGTTLLAPRAGQR